MTVSSANLDTFLATITYVWTTENPGVPSSIISQICVCQFCMSRDIKPESTCLYFKGCNSNPILQYLHNNVISSDLITAGPKYPCVKYSLIRWILFQWHWQICLKHSVNQRSKVNFVTYLTEKNINTSFLDIYRILHSIIRTEWNQKRKKHSLRGLVSTKMAGSIFSMCCCDTVVQMLMLLEI